MSKSLKTTILLFLALTPSIILANQPVCPDKFCFDPRRDELDLIGSASFRYWGFRVYEAALYSDSKMGISKISDSTILPSQKLVYILKYHRPFSTEDFIKSGEELLNKNPSFRGKSWEEPLKQLRQVYLPVQEGDEYKITFTPGVGLEFELNGKLTGAVQGDEFARLYLGIWLLPKYSIGQEFSTQLLGG